MGPLTRTILEVLVRRNSSVLLRPQTAIGRGALRRLGTARKVPFRSGWADPQPRQRWPRQRPLTATSSTKFGQPEEPTRLLFYVRPRLHGRREKTT
jgi:hypothetical protein